MIKLNGTILTFTKFPNGETKVNGNEIYNLLSEQPSMENHVEFKYETDEDLIKLMFVKRHIDYFVKLDTILTISYMPYSRQDRVEGNSVFTLKYVADFINSLDFTGITILEPHSDVTMALVNYSQALYPTIHLLQEVMREIKFDRAVDYIFYPDAGAYKRYSKMNNTGCKTLVGFKDRDFATGRIKSLQVVGDVSSTPFKVLIVDDLCSKGGTFALASDKLKELGATDVYLLVTHCEHAIFDGMLPFTGAITKVFTTDSIIDGSIRHPKIKIYQGGKT